MTLAKDRAVLHCAFEHALRLKLVESSPVAATELPRSDGRDPVIIDDTQFERLLEAAKGPSDSTL